MNRAGKNVYFPKAGQFSKVHCTSQQFYIFSLKITHTKACYHNPKTLRYLRVLGGNSDKAVHMLDQSVQKLTLKQKTIILHLVWVIGFKKGLLSSLVKQSELV